MTRMGKNNRNLYDELREAVVRYLLERDGDKCGFCGGLLEEPPKLVPGYGGKTPAGGITLDHILPVSKGGLNKLQNIRLLHKSCNTRAFIGPIELEKKRQRWEDLRAKKRAYKRKRKSKKDVKLGVEESD